MEFTKEELGQVIGQAVEAAMKPVRGFMERVTERLERPVPTPPAAGQGTPKPTEAKPEAAAPAVDQDGRIQAMEEQLLRATFERHLPKTINPDRAALAFDVLTHRGQILQRGGKAVIRLERNGQVQEVPIEKGLTEWASTAEADPFSLPPAGGTGAQPQGETGERPAGQKVKAEEILGKALGQALG